MKERILVFQETQENVIHPGVENKILQLFQFLKVFCTFTSIFFFFSHGINISVPFAASCRKAIWLFSSTRKPQTLLTSFRLQFEHLQTWLTSSQSKNVVLLSSFLTLSQVTALREGKCQIEANGQAQVCSLSHMPRVRTGVGWGETWKEGVITQPSLKKENDNNRSRASHGKQPRSCV